MAWTNEIAAVAVAALAVYLLRHGSSLAEEEQRLFRIGECSCTRNAVRVSSLCSRPLD